MQDSELAPLWAAFFLQFGAVRELRHHLELQELRETQKESPHKGLRSTIVSCTW